MPSKGPTAGVPRSDREAERDRQHRRRAGEKEHPGAIGVASRMRPKSRSACTAGTSGRRIVGREPEQTYERCAQARAHRSHEAARVPARRVARPRRPDGNRGGEEEREHDQRDAGQLALELRSLIALALPIGSEQRDLPILQDGDHRVRSPLRRRSSRSARESGVGERLSCLGIGEELIADGRRTCDRSPSRRTRRRPVPPSRAAW